MIVDEASKHCICIDPASEKSLCEIEYIEQYGLTLDYILLSHEHTDHTWGVNALIDVYPSAKVLCSEACKHNLAKEFQAYFLLYYDNIDYNYTVCNVDLTTEQLGHKLQWNGYEVESINTPGHSYGSVCYLIEGMLFTGDTILQSKPYINKRNGSRDDFKKSVRLLLDRFDGNQFIYPGHGEPFLLNEWKLYFKQ